MPWMFTAAGIRFSVVEAYEEDVAALARDSVAAIRNPKLSRIAALS
jgi:hypothetical protein